MMPEIQLSRLGILVCALLQCAFAAKHCPQVSLDLSYFGIQGCPPSFEIQTEAEMKAILEGTQCKSWGKWTTPPSKGCSSPSQLPEGLKLKFPCGCRFGDICKTACEAGYEMIGEHIVTCLNTGSWSALPVCMPLKCEPPSLPVTMRVEGNCSHREGSECRVSCITPEYRLVGEDRIKCQNQIWTHIPECQLRCNLGEIPRDLVVTHRCDGEEGEICSFKCTNEITKLYGERNIACLPGGQWERFPYCGCRVEDLPPMIEIESDCKKAVNSECPAKCLTTYERKGQNDKMYCGPDGKWILETSIKCLKLCGGPPLHSNQRLKGECSGKEGASCEAECKESYMRLVGSPTFRCLASGKYTELPICTSPERCPNEAISETLKTSGCSYLTGVTCTVQCKDSRADLVGPDRITCQVSGSWSDTPRCEMNCGLPQLSPYVKIEQCATKEGSKCTLRCVPGYEPETDMVITCLNTEQWSGTPKCVKVCPEFNHTDDVVIKTGCTRIVNTTCTLSCREPKHKILPTDTIECLPDGQWTPPQIECRKQCDGPVFPPGVFKVVGSCDFLAGNKCTIECVDPSLMLVGSGVVECAESGQHMTRNICSRPCGTPNLPEGVKVRSQCTTNVPITECEISCTNSLATVTGPTSIKCNEGDWHISSKCEIVCKEPKMKEHSRIVGVCSYQDNSECRVKCNDPAATMDGKSEYIITCKNTEWSEAPHCEVLCDPLNTSPSLQVRPCSRKKGTTCQVICADTGATLIGTPFLTCIGANWNGIMPTCARMCQQPNLPTHLEWTATCDRKIGDKCGVKCGTGFSLAGTPEISCLETQNWSEYPTCKIKCPVLPSHLVPKDQTCTRAQGSSCRVKCKDNSKIIKSGPDKLVCNENATWNAEIICGLKGVCEPPPGTIFQAACEPRQKDCRVQCEGQYEGGTKNFYLKAGQNVMLNCDKNGKVSPWKECVVRPSLGCGHLKSPFHTLEGSSFVKYTASCEDDYELVGKAEILCEADSWGTLPKCSRKCNVAELIARNLSVVYSLCKPYAGEYCATECNDGHTIDYICPYCNEDGNWTEIPTCGGPGYPGCSVFGPPMSFTGVAKGVYRAQCKEENFVPVGRPAVSCLANRTATPPPACRAIKKKMQCVNPSFFAGSLLKQCADKELFDEGESCLYELQCEGQPVNRTFFCMSTGEWSHPSCVELP